MVLQLSPAARLAQEIRQFLTSSKEIRKINFAFKKRSQYKIYPSAYYNDVVNAVGNGDIAILTDQKLPMSISAGYDSVYDRFLFRTGFALSDFDCQCILVHECAHAHLDIQAFGRHSMVEDEAVAYVAEAVFTAASGIERTDNSDYRLAARDLARRILKGEYWFEDEDIDPLLVALSKLPEYRYKTVVSNGYKRTFRQSVYRKLAPPVFDDSIPVR